MGACHAEGDGTKWSQRKGTQLMADFGRWRPVAAGGGQWRPVAASGGQWRPVAALVLAHRKAHRRSGNDSYGPTSGGALELLTFQMGCCTLTCPRPMAHELGTGV